MYKQTYIMGVVKYAIWAIDRARTGHVEVLSRPYNPSATGNLMDPQLWAAIYTRG